MPREETLEERVERHDRDLRDHAKTLSSIVEKLTGMEMAAHERAIREARIEERAIARGEALDELKTQVTELKKDLSAEINAIKGVGTKLMWIVIVSVVGAFLAFVYKGGLNI